MHEKTFVLRYFTEKNEKNGLPNVVVIGRHKVRRILRSDFSCNLVIAISKTSLS